MSMEKLVLVGEGVFPITKDAKGNALGIKPQTGIEVAGTIQGEGKLAGTPSLFVRLASCNLRCIWSMQDGSLSRCDTAYASFHVEDKKVYDVSEIFSIIKHNMGQMQHLVITGGEPILQAKGLVALCQMLKKELSIHITIETNGTLFDHELVDYIDLFSISPKLSNSVPTLEKMQAYGVKPSGASQYHAQTRKDLGVLQEYVDCVKLEQTSIQLKFVVGQVLDVHEIKDEFIACLNGLDKKDVMLMPLGSTVADMVQSSHIVLSMCVSNGWSYSPRMHINLFGCKQGV